MKELFGLRGFWLFLIIIFLNAVIDLGHKITVQNVLIKSFEGPQLVILSAVVNALILLPFILFFMPSAKINRRWSKTRVMQACSAAAVVLTLLITFLYAKGWFLAAFGATFVLAMQSAFFSPAKYAMIKDIAGPSRLPAANAVVQALTIAAILLSSLGFSLLFETIFGNVYDPARILPNITQIGFLLVFLSFVQMVLAFNLPYFAPGIKAAKDIGLGFIKQLHVLRQKPHIFTPIIALSIFWGLSQLVIAAFPAHYKTLTGSDNTAVIQAILALSAVGIALGALQSAKIAAHTLHFASVAAGGLAMAVCVVLLAFVDYTPALFVISLLYGFFAGLYVVPLNAAIQYFSPNDDIAQVLAANNFMQNIAMLVFLGAVVGFVLLGLEVWALFVLAAFTLVVTVIWFFQKEPQLLARGLLRVLVAIGYDLNVTGLEHIPPRGGALLLGNHVSWIDWLVLQAAIPRGVRFVMYKQLYDLWYLRPLLRFFHVIALDEKNTKSAIRQMRTSLDEGHLVLMFPEGHISYNGQLGRFKRGFEVVMKNRGEPIIPFYIHGLWESTFSRAQKHYKTLQKGRKQITVGFAPNLAAQTDAAAVKSAVTRLSYTTWNESMRQAKPMHRQWLAQAKKSPFHTSVHDFSGKALSNFSMLTSVLYLSAFLRPRLKGQKHIAILLPASAGSCLANLTLFVLNKTSVNLNYTLDSALLQEQIKQADCTTVITARAFIQKLEQRGLNHSDVAPNMYYLEDIFASFAKTQKLWYGLQSLLLPAWVLKRLHFAKTALSDTAVILFSSGSEKQPKAIMLSHANISANGSQIAQLLNFARNDVVLNSLPPFHSFGLVVSQLMPLAKGITQATVPDPTDALAVGQSVAKNSATILFGTSSFYRIYTKSPKIDPLMFVSLRIAIAGAMKLDAAVAEGFYKKFGLTLYEGYGATETSPVVSVNLPDVLEPQSLQPLRFYKPGSVGHPIPGTAVTIVDPKTMRPRAQGKEGMVLIGGCQVMQGYYKQPEKTAEVLLRKDAMTYYISGDMGYLDEEGFLYITGRYSRFVKIGGEMVSLQAIEAAAARIGDENTQVCACGVGDGAKGEQVALLFSSGYDTQTFKDLLIRALSTALMRPKYFFKIDQIPLLSSGKIDYAAADRLAKELVCS